jgi:hypothetical protein
MRNQSMSAAGGDGSGFAAAGGAASPGGFDVSVEKAASSRSK